jgi:hypothetical protein
MALIKGVFTDQGRLWLARVLAEPDPSVTPLPFKTTGFHFFRVGEGGFQVLPSLQKIPIAPSTRIGLNGIVAGYGLKDASLNLVNPDAAPAADKVTILVADVPDVDSSLFFAQKNIAPTDMVITLVGGVYKVTVTATLDLNEANTTFAAQGSHSPSFFEIGMFARYTLDGTTPTDTPPASPAVLLAYGTFPEEMKVISSALINKVIFEI